MGKLDSILLLGALALAGCSGQPSNSDELLGQATLAVTNAPADAGCLRVNVVGSRTITRSFDLMPGQSTVFTLNGLPLGADTFQEDAFASACSAVTMGSISTWTSDPTVANLVAGNVTNLTIVLRRNGTAVVSSDFQDDPDAGSCVPPGGACMASATCCTGNSCVAGVCTSAACLPPQQVCMTAMGSVCVNTSGDIGNCGSCGNVCPNGANAIPQCAMGVCGSVCNPGFSDCDGVPANGCEINNRVDANNCGGCGIHCPPMTTACQNGMCIPVPPGAPVIQVTPSPVVFPNTPLMTASNLSIQLRNVGGFASTLNVFSANIGGPNPGDFHLNPPLPPFNLPGGATQLLNLTFTPTGPALRQGILQIQSNDPMQPMLQVPLSGSGI